MTKKIIISVLAFVGAFIIGILVFFPFGGVAGKYIMEAADKNKIDLKFDTLDIGLFGAKISGLKTGDIRVDQIIVKYNPIGALFKRFSFEAESPLFIATGSMKGETVVADVKGSVASVASLVGYKGAGSLNINCEYNITSKEGVVKVAGGEVSFTHPMMTVDVTSIDATADIKGNLITVGNIQAKGKNSLEGKGTVAINPGKIEYSQIDFQGTTGFMGMNMNFKLLGPAYSPKFITQ